MKISLFFLVIATFVSSPAYSDRLGSAVKIEFIPEIKALYVTPASVYFSSKNQFSKNTQKKIEQKYGLYGVHNMAIPVESNNSWILHPVKKIFTNGNTNISVTLTPAPQNPNPNGLCGAVVDVHLTLTVNGKTILDHCPAFVESCDRANIDSQQVISDRRCSDGIYYDVGSDSLFTHTDAYLNVSENGFK